MSNSKTNLSSFLASIENIDGNSFSDESDRFAAIQAARKLCHRIERPWDRLIQLTWIQPLSVATIQVGLDTGLFTYLVQANGQSRSIEEIAKATDVEADFAGRVLKHLAAIDFVQDEGAGSYSANAFTTAVIKPLFGYAALGFYYDAWLPTTLHMPKYLADVKYKVPESSEYSASAYGLDTPGVPWWQYLRDNPEKAKRFGMLMAGYNLDRQLWTEVYPTEDILQGAKDQGTLIVDVGGNVGSDVERFLKKHPDTKGRHLVQDQAHVIASIEQANGFKAEVHDFFQPQPIQGARAYFMHSILHDWTNEPAIKILEALKPALEKGYSKLLIFEIIIPPEGANTHMTTMDWIMMGFFGNRERTRKQWTDLLTLAGYKITRILPGRVESIIEAELA